MTGRGQRHRGDQRGRAQTVERQFERGRPDVVVRDQVHRPGQRGGGDDVGQRGGRPAGAPGRHHRPAHPGGRAIWLQPHPDGDHGQRHADPEPDEVPRQEQPPVRPVEGVEQRGRVDERERRVHADPGEQPPREPVHVMPALGRAAPRVPGQHRRRGGQRHVERGLHDQAPHLPQVRGAEVGAPPLVGPVGVRQREEPHPRPRLGGMGEARGEHEGDDHRPVGGQDAYRALAEVAAGTGLGGPWIQHPGGPRPVQQQPGEGEEDGDADLAAVVEPLGAVEIEHQPGRARHVVDEHQQGGDRPDAVEPVLVPGDLRHRRRAPSAFAGPGRQGAGRTACGHPGAGRSGDGSLRRTRTRFHVATSRSPGIWTMPSAQRGW
jgi:hypothetical protein